MKRLLLPGVLLVSLFASAQATLGSNSPAPQTQLAQQQAAPAQELLGSWEQLRRSKGGVGGTYEFLSDGTLKLSIGALIDYRYHRDGSRFVATDPSAPAKRSAPPIFAVEIQGDDLLEQLPGNAAAVRLVRIGDKPSQPTILGKWKIDRSSIPATSSGTATEQQAQFLMVETSLLIFTADGRALLRVPFRTQTGKYRIQDDSLVMDFGGSTVTLKFRFQNGHLITTRPGQTDDEYERAQW